jgi:Abortive infection alpha
MAEESGALRTLANVSDLLNKLAAPAAEQIGQLLGYKLHPYTVKNFVATMKKTERILRAAGLPANPVPPRLLLPIADGSSIEDNESLQELWAGLLATASQQGDSVSPSFIETLRQLTPDEARYLHGLYLQTHRKNYPLRKGVLTPIALTERDGAPKGCGDTFERLGLIRREHGFAKKQFSGDDPEIGHLLIFTNYSARFLSACRGPRPKVVDAAAPAGAAPASTDAH